MEYFKILNDDLELLHHLFSAFWNRWSCKLYDNDDPHASAKHRASAPAFAASAVATGLDNNSHLTTFTSTYSPTFLAALDAAYITTYFAALNATYITTYFAALNSTFSAISSAYFSTIYAAF